jgi:hypothetical protein
MKRTAALLVAILFASCGSSLKSTGPSDGDAFPDIHVEPVGDLPADVPPDTPADTTDPESPTTWGKTTSHMIRGEHSDIKMMGGTTHDIDNMVVTSLNYHALNPGTLTIALYSGGALDNAQGATRLTEAHDVAVSEGWNEIDVPDVSLPRSAVAWIAWAKTGTGAQTLCSDNPSDAGDFQSARGRYTIAGTSDYGGHTTLPATVGSGTFSGAYWHDVYADIVIE